jgi:hypothetical protein
MPEKLDSKLLIAVIGVHPNDEISNMLKLNQHKGFLAVLQI